MRTTLELDDEVLAVARSIAEVERISLGAAVSELARAGMTARSTAPIDISYSPFPVIVGEGVLVTDELVAEHRDE